MWFKLLVQSFSYSCVQKRIFRITWSMIWHMMDEEMKMCPTICPKRTSEISFYHNVHGQWISQLRILFCFVRCSFLPLQRLQYIFKFDVMHSNTLPYIIVHLCNTKWYNLSCFIWLQSLVQRCSRKMKLIRSKFMSVAMCQQLVCFLWEVQHVWLFAHTLRYWCVISWIISCFATDMHKYYPRERLHILQRTVFTASASQQKNIVCS